MLFRTALEDLLDAKHQTTRTFVLCLKKALYPKLIILAGMFLLSCDRASKIHQSVSTMFMLQ